MRSSSSDVHQLFEKLLVGTFYDSLCLRSCIKAEFSVIKEFLRIIAVHLTSLRFERKLNGFAVIPTRTSA